MIDWKQFSLNQQRYIVHMMTNPDATQKDAAGALGITTRTIQKWPASVNEAVSSSLEDTLRSTKSLLEQHALEAVMLLSKQMTSADERVAQAAAVKVLEWSIGKPTQALEHTGKDKEKLIVQIVWTDDDDNSGHDSN